MFAEFHEEDRPIMVAVPAGGRNLPLTRVDGHERARPDKGIQSVIILSDISVYRVGTGHALERKRNLIPGFNHLGHQIGPFGLQLLSQFRRQLHSCFVDLGDRPDHIGVWQGESSVFFQGFVGGYATENCHPVVVASVDDTEGVEPVKTGGRLAAFNVSEGRSGYFVIVALPPAGDALAQGLYVAQ